MAGRSIVLTEDFHENGSFLIGALQLHHCGIGWASLVSTVCTRLDLWGIIAQFLEAASNTIRCICLVSHDELSSSDPSSRICCTWVCVSSPVIGDSVSGVAMLTSLPFTDDFHADISAAVSATLSPQNLEFFPNHGRDLSPPFGAFPRARTVE